MKKVFLVAGARPNLMKVAPIFRAARDLEGVECQMVYTGQHYDRQMSQVFFEDLDIPKPKFNMGKSTGTHAEQTGAIMIAFEKMCMEEKPDLVVVVGDVNSTLACSVTARKLHIPVAHVEAGLRSGDMDMPEEINRMVTDSISNLFFTTEDHGRENLLREGKDADTIFHVGNVMIDNLFHNVDRLGPEVVADYQSRELKEKIGRYGFMTMHRPSNVDNREVLEGIVEALNKIAEDLPLLFPIHPRTEKMMAHFGVSFSENVHTFPPLSFRESLFLWKDAQVVITDSGGLQEETTALGVPCVTVRKNTERPVTIEKGTNVLAGISGENILRETENALKKTGNPAPKIDGWDGHASERIWKVLLDFLS
ncbi:non-hydrolyzing UDP-N-acetylglucosamine 2-epimerase [Maridesulfovibrio salexigens]|uniref:UDP-N-acetylglucosamine 2-epimerase n=1 Tax=Maridesulfovibrio salexigens (strain ATCC 14822 / DSM 2638 / NCIMB 8403 / VKM B-1763) TaxID=526222 RepID=C6BTZ2_MARSD|nr:UDP-N-acetylglucosamine 2-epimerase (non-hydrolyzing) [Maridesulfovibrio salexigens]ACS81701.1 UDP-N-acetylglucosamine 2-epimerase [Maridesulfovibrio salexigens DSM 2638]